MADPLLYREVTGLWTVRVPDGPDTDAYPDTVPLAGRVVFTPDYRKPLVYPGEHVIVEPINAVLVDGVLMAENIDGESLVLGPLFLPVTVDDRADQTWAWEMSFHDLRLGEYGETVELRPVRFQVPAGEDALDLSTVVPVSSSGGVITVRGERGPGITDITSDSGVVTVEWEGGDDVQIPIPTAALATPTSDGLMPAADKAKLDGVWVDASVGTRVFVGGIMIHGDTGWVDVTDSMQVPALSGRVLVKRKGDEVQVVFDGLRVEDTGTKTLLILPGGYRPFWATRQDWYVPYAASGGGSVNISPNGYLVGYNLPGSGVELTAVIRFDTEQPFPTL